MRQRTLVSIPREEKGEHPPQPAPGLTAIPQHHQMYTPPSSSPGPSSTLPSVDFPFPSFKTPTKKEERAIAQKNQFLANAEANMRYLGLHLVDTPTKVVVASISTTNNVSDPTGSAAQGKPIVLKNSSSARLASSWKINDSR